MKEVHVSTQTFEEIIRESEQYYVEDYPLMYSCRKRVTKYFARKYQLGDVLFIEKVDKMDIKIAQDIVKNKFTMEDAFVGIPTLVKEGNEFVVNPEFIKYCEEKGYI